MNKKIFILIVVFVAVGVFVFLNFKQMRIVGNSMEPLLKNGQTIIVNKAINNFKRGDIIVFDLDGKIYIKRIMGVPGDLVVSNGFLYINGESVFNSTKERYSVNTGEDYIIPEGKFFVLADNVSSGMLDSRSFGYIEKEWIIGRVID